MDDNLIIDKVLAGNIECYAFLVEKYKKMVMSICYRVIENYHEAEELTQDVFLRAFKSLDNHRRSSKFSNWIYRIAYTQSISYKRKFRIITEEINDNLTQNNYYDINEGIASLEIFERNKTIDYALDQLKPDEKFIVTLFYYGECSIDDISEITNLSSSNIKVQLHRIRKKLYMHLRSKINELLNN